MNRAERRRLLRESQKEPIIHIKATDIQNLKKQISENAANTVFSLMLAIPVMVLHDKYAQLMKKNVDGKTREERFADMCLELYDSYQKGYVTLEDLEDCLWKEAGIKLQKE